MKIQSRTLMPLGAIAILAAAAVLGGQSLKSGEATTRAAAGTNRAAGPASAAAPGAPAPAAGNPTTLPAPAASIEAITRPSDDVTLSFTRPGQIARVLVKEGQEVKPGEVLAEQDDRAERIQLEQLKAQAEDPIRVKAAEAQLESKKVDLKKIEGAFSRSAATELEVEHARVEVVIADLSVQLAAFEKQQDQRKYEDLKAQVERMRMASPVAGVVEKVMLHAGEGADPQAKVLRVVQTDPLWLDVPVPLSQAAGMKLGQELKIEFPGGAVGRGKIIHIAAVADAASNTRGIRLEAPNPSHRPAGEHVMVGRD